MSTPERARNAKSPRTGTFAALAARLRAKGSGAPSTGSRSLPSVLGCLAATIGLLLTLAPAAQADFGLQEFSGGFFEGDGSPATQAGSHPFAQTIDLRLNTRLDSRFISEENPEGEIPDGEVKDLRFFLPPGFVGSRTAVPQCSTADFLELHEAQPSCPNSTAIGITRATVLNPKAAYTEPVYNLTPPPGVAAKIGFAALAIPITVEISVNPAPPHNLIATLHNVPQAAELYGASTELWGVPAAPAHDALRGHCLRVTPGPQGELVSVGSCPTNTPEVPFLTLPRSCQGPLATTYEALSWQEPQAEPAGGLFESPPISGCSRLAFSPSIAAQPTSKAASSPSGLDFSLDVSDEGIANPHGLAASDIEKVEVTLPEGMSANPSLAEGLTTCSEADLAKETAFSEPGAGCPEASKIGTVEVESPLLDQSVKGALYIAEPYQNPLGSLLALYVVLQSKSLGISIVQPLRVEPDPQTGQLTTVAEDLPQLPFSHFKLHFREGTHSPLATPPSCDGDPSLPGNQPFAVNATLYPRAGGEPVESTSTFQVITGPGEGPCPSAGLPPFHPNLLAGTLNNAAGHFSPFNVRISRTDSEQEITHFSIKLPPGVVGKLAGIPFCPDAAIAAAKARTGPLGGHEELAAPSCPAASEIGHTLVGSGVGPSLTYVPGRLYLAGPYHGAPISIVAITSGVAGPFDLGTVVVREALKVNPETAEVFIDATGSDPIPHIIKGIPVHLRDIRVYTDRPEFVLNPTDCTRTSTASTVLGSGLDFASEADDNPITVTSPFQAADCAALGFKPTLKLRLIGKTKRGGFPALRAEVTQRPGEASIARARVTLPHSEFLEQGHIGTVCTRVQFASGAGDGTGCPAAAVYGHAMAITPLLDQPLEGPVFLRSNPEHELPDLVAALHGQEINVDLVGHIEGVKGGMIRNTFETVPDAPVSRFVLEMGGGRKSLLINSTDICQGTHRAAVNFTAHNGKVDNFRPALQAKCKKVRSRHHKRHGKRGRR